MPTNKLKKKREQEHSGVNPINGRISLTLQHALNLDSAGSPSRNKERELLGTTTTPLERREIKYKADQYESYRDVHPQTPTERYWVGRALVAETLLGAHRPQQAPVVHETPSNYSNKLTNILIPDGLKANIETRVMLEWVVVGFVFALLAMIFYTIHRLTHPTLLTPSRRSSGLHFTIPVLSPFTSVVEHESSTFGFPAIATVTVVAGLVLYGLARYWIGSRFSG